MFDKNKLKEFLKDQVSQALDKAREVSKSSAELATDGEMKQEGKYDTRSIEAGYLAGAQKKRVEELEQELELVDSIPTDTSKKSISLGSLVELETQGSKRWYYLSSTSGGVLIPTDKTAVLVVSVFSPLGNELINLEVSDEVEVEQGGKERVYKVVSIH